MAKIQIIQYPNCYRIKVDNEQSDPAEYGALLEFQAGGKTYGALFHEDGAQTEIPVWEYVKVQAVVVKEKADPEDYEPEDGVEEEEEESEEDEEDSDDDSDSDDDDEDDPDDGERKAA